MPLKKTDQKSKTSNQKNSRSQLSLTATKKPHYLSNKSLPIDNPSSESQHHPVPPSSPRELVPDVQVTPIPNKFPALKNVTLPIVREVGVKQAITKLSEIFGCAEYELNLIQFWFLDILADCIWRAQDEFRFPERDQKIVLEWILFTFDLIRAQHLNLSRKKLFSMFTEALSVAEDYIESGCPSVPLPQEIFFIRLCESFEKSSGSSTTSESSGSLKSVSSGRSLLAIKFQENVKYFKLPEKTCAWDTDDECLSSSVESLSEDERPGATEDTDISNSEVETTEDSMDEEIEFYKPDMRTPPRFKNSIDESSSTSSESSIREDSTKEESEEASWKAEKRYIPRTPCPTEIFDFENDFEKEENEIPQRQEEKAFEAWFDYHLWQLRKQRLDNSMTGFSGEMESLQDCGDHHDKETNKIRVDMENLLKNISTEDEQTKKNTFVNTCVLLAIKKLVFDYFYESFQYSLVKMAFRYPQHLITQELNQEWYIPKTFKSELKKPQPKKIKAKKEKTPKAKKEKKEKTPKKDKKDKKSSKSSKSKKSPKKDDKGSKKSKKKDDKGSKKSKKKDDKESKKSKKKDDKDSKKSKKNEKAVKGEAKALLEAEKAAEARRKREEQEAEEQRRQAEDNRRFMFPLTEAATDTFFQTIFENWVKPKTKSKLSKNKSSKLVSNDKSDKDNKKKKSDKKDKSEKKSDTGKKKKEKKGKKK